MALAATLLLGSGCASLRWPFASANGLARGYTQEELGGELAAYAARFGALVGDTANEIIERSPVRAVRKRALVWQLEIPPRMEEIAFGDSPQLAYVASVFLATAQQRYFAEGDGRDLFGDLQPLAVDAANALVEDVLGIGDRFLTKREIDEVATRTREFADKYPIRGREFSVQSIPRAKVQAEVSSSLAWVVKLPLSPFVALQGVDSGAAAIRDFNRTAQEFAQVAKLMPERIRGQLELFAYDLEDRETVQRSVGALDRAATSAERAATLAEHLPDELRRMLTQSQDGVAAVGRVVEQSQAVATPIADAATQLEQASAHWLAILGPKEPGPPNPNARPFDVRDWQAAAQSIGAAAGELRGLATDLQTVSGAASLDAAIDHAFWRGIALIVLFFVALLGYRFAAVRIARPRPRDG